MACTSGCDAPSKYTTCAARMEDGHAFTDYRPRCAVNAELYNMVAKANMTNSSYESRMFLQNNGESIMKSNFEWAQNQILPCAPCHRPFSDDGTMLPEKYVVRCNTTSCVRTEVNPNGIGDGRVYSTF